MTGRARGVLDERQVLGVGRDRLAGRPPLEARLLGARRSVAFTAAVTLGLSRVLWSQSIVAEVYSLHLLFVAALFAYFPFSKLVHLGGVFLSPTRNLANNNRAVRHVNPWNPEVEVHEYDHW